MFYPIQISRRTNNYNDHVLKSYKKITWNEFQPILMKLTTYLYLMILMCELSKIIF